VKPDHSNEIFSAGSNKKGVIGITKRTKHFLLQMGGKTVEGRGEGSNRGEMKVATHRLGMQGVKIIKKTVRHSTKMKKGGSQGGKREDKGKQTREDLKPMRGGVEKPKGFSSPREIGVGVQGATCGALEKT